MFVELINMHAMTLRVHGVLPLVGGHHNNVGVSLRERRATTQVMLGVSLRARWDATLVQFRSGTINKGNSKFYIAM